jgi:hypothetical protein
VKIITNELHFSGSKPEHKNIFYGKESELDFIQLELYKLAELGHCRRAGPPK